MTVPRLALLPNALAVARDQSGHIDVVVRLSAPAVESSPSRPAMNLALVIDCSGSMSGRPIQEAKAAARGLVERMQAGDQICVIGYGAAGAWIAAEPVEALQGRGLVLAAIDRLQAAGGTPLRQGWLMGANALAPTVSRFGISQVLLLSDGQATDGSTPHGLEAEARELAAAGIGTSTYGLGHNFNEDLMTRLASGGGGQAFFAETADSLLPYFESEFAMLAATVGKKIAVTLRARTAQGKDLAPQRLDTLASTGVQPMPSLVAGADSFVAFRVPHDALGDKGALRLEAEVTWESLDGQPHQERAEVTVPARVRAKPTEDAWALERLKEVDASRIQREALESARRGDWNQAENLLRGVQGSAMGNAYISGTASVLQDAAATRDLSAFAKQALYACSTMASRTVDVGENAADLDGGRFGLRKANQGKAAPKAGA